MGDRFRAWVAVGAALVAVGVPSSASAATWTSGFPRGLTGATVVADPSVPGRVYLTAFDESAVWVTEDRGAHWARRASQDAFRAFAVYPGPPGTVVAIASSREVWRSVDQARTWQRVGCCAEAIDPNDPQRLIGIDANLKLQRSTDGGASWQSAATVGPAPTPNSFFRYGFDGGGRVWAESGTGTVYRSADLGTTWTVMTGVPDGFLSPVAGDAARLWVGPWRSLDGGGSWQRSSPPGPACDAAPAHGPGSPLAVWTLGCTGLYRSTDGGDLWTLMAGTAEHAWTDPSTSVGVLAGGQAAIVDGWQGPWLVEGGRPPQYRAEGLPPMTGGPILADPSVPGRAYAGTFMTRDGATTWTPSPGLPALGLARAGQRLVVATAESVVSRPAAGGSATTLLAAPAHVAPDPLGRRAWIVTGGRIHTSSDGVHLRQLPTRLLDGARPEPDEIAVAAGGRLGRTLAIEFFRNGSKLAVSQDGGRSFFVRKLGFGGRTLAVDAIDGRLIIVLDATGTLSISRHGGRQFGSQVRFVSAVAVDPTRRGRWYIVRRGRLLRTVDAGRRWQPLTRPSGGGISALSAGRGRLWATTATRISWLPLSAARP